MDTKKAQGKKKASRSAPESADEDEEEEDDEEEDDGKEEGSDDDSKDEEVDEVRWSAVSEVPPVKCAVLWHAVGRGSEGREEAKEGKGSRGCS